MEFTLWTNRDGTNFRRPRNFAGFMAIVALALAGPSVANAQPAQNAHEARTDRAEMARDRVQLRGDIQDVRRFERLLLRLDSAQRAGDKQGEAQARKRIYAFLRGEAGEGRRDVAADRRELGRSAQEVRSDRRELAHDQADLTRAKEGGTDADLRDAERDLARDRYDLRDDRRDRRDDRRDLEGSRRRSERQRDILRELRSIEPDMRRGNAPARSKERALFDEFLRISREDAVATGRELREDRRESREDYRERRDDRRESAEPR